MRFKVNELRVQNRNYRELHERDQRCTRNVQRTVHVTKGETWEAAHQLRNKAGGALSMCQHPRNHTKATKQATEINVSINPTAKNVFICKKYDNLHRRF